MTTRDNYRLCREATGLPRRKAVVIAVSVRLLDSAKRLNRWAVRRSSNHRRWSD